MERHLAAILAADVVGYSRLMGEDEPGTLAALKTHRKEIFGPKAAQYHGRTVKLMGDGALMEFGSVMDAVAFAVEVQVAVAQRNSAIPQARQIVYRIGINIGDIIVEGDDIYGDGVNVAARLEGLADPGGICVAHNVYDQVKHKLDLSFENLGEKTVKNIAEPITVYGVLIDDKAAALATPLVPGPAGSPRRWRLLAGGALAVLAVAAGAALWWQPWTPQDEPAFIERMALALPDGPSIAVLPFNNISGDADQEYFVDGMTEDLITDLSKVPGLFVIARNSSFSYKDQQVNVRQVSEELGVRYVLEGSVRRIGDEVRINAQLIDATTGGHLWAERYDRRLDNIFAVQNAITEEIVQALELQLTESDQARADKRPPTPSLEAYDLVLRARKFMTRLDRAAALEARRLLHGAVEIDPAYSEAHSLLGFSYFDEWRVWGAEREQSLARAQELATTAAELSPQDPAPHVLSALVHQWRREFDAANAQADEALTLDPQDA
ncbi:MAG: guanylyl cyclase, partial [Kiloniellaceae bacterium]|nr:guanylyl cyclase [Kiloniellaceae bacterium]